MAGQALERQERNLGDQDQVWGATLLPLQEEIVLWGSYLRAGVADRQTDDFSTWRQRDKPKRGQIPWPVHRPRKGAWTEERLPAYLQRQAWGVRLDDEER